MRMRCLRMVLLMLIVLLLSGCQTEERSVPVAREGTMDLSAWDFDRDGNVSLDGNWAFYWNQLVAPDKFKESEVYLTGFYDASLYWTKYRGLKLPSKGFATYHLQIRTGSDDECLSLRVPPIYTEYSLWVNGDLIERTGSFKQDKVRFIRPDVYTFVQKEQVMDIALQIKNDAHLNAGLGQSLILGTPYGISKERNAYMAVDTILFVISITSCLYHFLLYLFRKKDRALLYFSVFCLMLMFRTLFSNENWIMQIFPGISFSLGSKLLVGAIPGCAMTLLAFSNRVNRIKIAKPVYQILLLVNAFYLLIVMVSPTDFFYAIFNEYLMMVALACAALMVSAILSCRHGGWEAILFLLGMTCLVTGAFNDMLYFNQILKTGYYLPAGLSVFMVFQSILLANRYARAHRGVEQLSENLKASLDKIQSAETAFLQAQIKPHFLYNALNTIAEYCETNPKEAGRLILSLSRYLRGTLDFENLSGMISLEKELALVKAYTAIEKSRFEEIQVEYNVPEDLPKMSLPPLTLQPLVENAIKHGLRKRQGGGYVQVHVEIAGDHLLFCVEDNGAGIPEDKLDALLAQPGEGGGIGLYNIHSRLVRFYGKGLTIDSVSGAGTKVRFVIPSGGSIDVKCHSGG